MLELENLDTQSFYEVLEAAKRKIPIYAPAWTNIQVSDPGITIIELLAWLDIIMHKYMSVFSSDTYYSLLSLLDINPIKNSPAHTILSVSHLEDSISIPRNTKWFSDNLVFENKDTIYLAKGEISKVQFFRDKFNKEITIEELNLSGGISLFGESDKVGYLKGNYFTISLTDMPALKEKVSFYFELTDSKRNPMFNCYPIAVVRWEYLSCFGEYENIEILEDKTQGFLCSGIITMKIPEEMLYTKNGYIIKATLEDEEYDICPRIKSVALNCFDVFQQNTLCDNLFIEASEIVDGRFKIKHYLARFGKAIVYLENKDNTYRPTENFVITTDEISIFDHSGENVVVVLYDTSIENYMTLGDATGISNQIFQLPVENVLEQSIKILVGKNAVSYEQWELTNNFSVPKSYIYNVEKRLIEFGDNIQGYAPFKSKNAIKIFGLATTMGENSNIKEGMINNSKVVDCDKIKQLTPAKGGRDSETLDELKARAGNVLSDNQRAITKQDYERIVGETPGLIVKNMKVIVADNCNMITIIVQGDGRAEYQPLKYYKQNILRYLESYRLVGTQIDVIWPKNIELSISLEVIVSPYYRESKSIVKNTIEKFVSNKKLGETFSYSELYGMLEILECVERVVSLDIVSESNGVVKTQTDDLIPPINGLYSVSSLTIDIVRSNKM